MTTTSSWTRDEAITALHATQGADPRTVRWDIATVLVLDSEAHFGGRDDLTDSDGAIDQRLHRDDSGRPSTLFSSVTGALLHHDQDRRYGYRVAGTPPALFGSAQRKGCLEGRAVVWRPPASTQLPASLVRSHTRVTPATGIAAPGALWSTEVLPIGSTALLILHVNLTPEEEHQRLAELLTACAGLHGGIDGIRWGARKRPGAGAATATDWVARRHDLSTLDGLIEAVTPTHADLAADLSRTLATAPAVTLQAALEAALPDTGTPPTWPAPADRRRWATLRMRLDVGVAAPDATLLPGLLLIADTPPPGWEHIDLVQRTIPRPDPTDPSATDWALALGGDATHSWLKRAAHLAAHAMAGTRPRPPGSPVAPSTARATDMVETWFGTLDPGGATAPRPGRVVIAADTTIRDARLTRRGRVPLDPVFGGSIAGLLFDEAPAAGGYIDVTVAVRDPDPAILGLLTQVAWDGAEVGLTTIGGHGHGLVTVTTATLCDDARADGHTYDLLADAPHDDVMAWVTTARSVITTQPARSSTTAVERKP